MRRLRLITLSLLAACACVGIPVLASDGDSKKRSASHLKCEMFARYPPGMADRHIEGWVNLRYTKTADGRIADPEVVSVFGPREFGFAAQKAITACRWRPEYDPKPGVELRNQRTRYYFRIEQQTIGADPQFGRKIQVARDLINSGQLDKALTTLEEIEHISTSLYEFNHVLIMRSALAAKRGDRNLALSYLLTVSDNKIYIGDSEYQQLLRMRLAMEIGQGQYVLAEASAQEVRESPVARDEELLGRLANLKDSISKGQPLRVRGTLPMECHPAICDVNQPNWIYSPYHRTVSLDEVQGQLDEVTFRCDSRTMTFKAEAGITWTIPKSWGNCRMEVSGKPGAAFAVIDETLQQTQPQ